MGLNGSYTWFNLCVFFDFSGFSDCRMYEVKSTVTDGRIGELCGVVPLSSSANVGLRLD